MHEEAKALRAMSSQEAADWILARYPYQGANWGRGVQLVGARSWLRPEQVRLAKNYLAGVSYANGRVYEILLSFMKVATFLKVLRDCIPRHPGDLELLKYHLPQSLRAACKSEHDRELVEAFLAEFG